MSFERTFTAEQILLAPIDEVFAFFSRAENLERITPPFLRFRILTPPSALEMRAGALIDYRLRVRGIPLRWRTEIREWNPPYSFVDVQLKGPYKLWHHTHRFEPLPGGRTLMTDTVRYAAPFGPLGALVSPFLVRPEIERIFAYRRAVIAKLFDRPVDAPALIRLLGLEPLEPEGGYFKQTFKDARTLTVDGKPRAASTCIYYLLTRESFSAFHRVKGTEIFHFLRGDPAELVTIDGKGALTRRTLGAAVEKGEEPQGLVRPMEWQALRVKDGGSWALFSTTVSPGFEYEDFELADRSALLREFPAHANAIRDLTR